ncbi:heterokaryon incompatibility protein-domain-containing protein [Boeremia exigua]|uniref:heterokaryon incompatibility protein-domain-containing protein n=1 Tax=Boeremia exigua TaxID=749465 RepID=UPI001E8CC1AD|nr:heterokaryon incompatibility protein-domain-containing protein [Boeremia exigua]KAH6639409.1 heterokaryon incompatibility protein-domain-containing protein [Boeremia exigua]
MPYDNSIRLLRIHKGTTSDPIEVTLEFARLDDTSPEYEALSYVWGSSVPVSYIICRTTQTSITVTRNLYDALKGMRRVDRDRVMWVDALCINQHDSKEKGTQVRKMNSIYASAARVVVWLGADDAGDAEGAFGLLCWLANLEGEGAHLETRSQDRVPIILEREVDLQDCNAWAKVMMFFCQTWFTRLWVLQEIVLAQDAIFMWGDYSIPWAHVGSAIESIRKNELIQSFLQSRNFHNAFLMWHLSTVFRNARHNQESETLPFLHLLDVARSFEVTDPRDKIYGLLGLPTMYDDRSKDPIIPNYALSASRVYTDVTRKYISREQNLDILALVLCDSPNSPTDQEHIDDLPSWVPNFNSKTTASPISNTNAGHQYSTGLSRSVHFRTGARPELLQLEGTVLDTVRAMGASIPFVRAHNMQRHIELLIRWYINAGITVHGLAKILTGGRDRTGQRLPPYQEEEIVAFLTDTMGDIGAGLVGTPTEGLDFNRNEGLKWKETVWGFITYRQPFVTETGMFGLGPQGLEEGDAVVALWGGQCPFVISDAGNGRWTLKGECYVEDWMHSAVVEALVRKEKKKDVFFEFV